jgi:hypothetical protein
LSGSLNKAPGFAGGYLLNLVSASAGFFLEIRMEVAFFLMDLLCWSMNSESTKGLALWVQAMMKSTH